MGSIVELPETRLKLECCNRVLAPVAQDGTQHLVTWQPERVQAAACKCVMHNFEHGNESLHIHGKYRMHMIAVLARAEPSSGLNCCDQGSGRIIASL